MNTQALNVAAYDPFSPAVMRDPLPFYKQLRRESPIHYIEKYDAFFCSRFSDIAEVLSYTDNTFMQSEGSLPTPAVLRKHNDGPVALPPVEPFPLSQRLGMPVHGEVRRAHVKPLMPRGAERLTEFVRDLAHERLDRLLPLGRFDLTREYGGIVSSSVLLKLMGMPLDLAGEALDIINSGTRTDPEIGGFDSGAVARQAIAFFLPYVEARMREGADGSVPMVDGMINWRFEGRTLGAPEVATQLVCAFIGGIETVPKITAHGLLKLSSRPEQMEAVRSDPETNVPKAVEEMIRYCAPAQWFVRTVHKPVTIAGRKMEPGQRVFLLLASANRDEAEYEDPDTFRWDRDIPRTLAFGQGIHFCIGTHVARMEIRTLVQTFLERVETFRFDLDAAVRHPSSFQWGYNELPVIVD